MKRSIAALVAALVVAEANAEEALQPLDEYERTAQVEELEAVAAQMRETLNQIEQRRPAAEAPVAPTGGKRAGFAPANGKIVNGVKTGSYPTVGALIKKAAGGHFGSWCSGTLIGSETFLTAAHCVEDDLDESSYRVFFQHGGVYELDEITMHGEYPGKSDADLAIIQLKAPVTGVEPTAINAADAVPTGAEGVIVGFGRSGGMNTDYGIKREGRVRTAACDDVGARLVCWNFDAPIGLAGEDSNTCNADSGGPLFIHPTAAGPWLVAGATSAGSRNDCLAGDHSWDAEVFRFAQWIRDEAGADLGRTADGLPVFGSDEVTVMASDARLDATNTSQAYTIPVPPNTKLLRVALNGHDDDTADFDLVVKEAGTAGSECKREERGQYGFCQFTDPPVGNATVTIRRKAGAGDFQVVATLFESAP